MDLGSTTTNSWTFSKLQFPFGCANFNSINGIGHSPSPLSDNPPRAFQPSSFLKKNQFYFRDFLYKIL